MFGNFLRYVLGEIYFRQICPKCGERMKYLRKTTGGGKLYTCYNCYKSWVKRDKNNFIETKPETK